MAQVRHYVTTRKLPLRMTNTTNNVRYLYIHIYIHTHTHK
jgi:hypothetical protein